MAAQVAHCTISGGVIHIDYSLNGAPVSMECSAVCSIPESIVPNHLLNVSPAEIDILLVELC